MSNRLVIGFLTAVLSPALMAQVSLKVKNNADVPLSLSQSNYNRLVVKGDKIAEVVFPEGAMAIKRDEQDGSAYVMLATQNPFTLFMTTESGRHFSVTVSGEDSLGKTIELVPTFAGSIVTQTKPATPVVSTLEEQTLVSLINHMETQKPLPGFTVKQVRKLERWQKGLMLTSREMWQGNQYIGEVVELYNGGHEPLALEESWFNRDDTQAVKLSQKQLLPKQVATLYRVTGGNHG